MSSQLNSPVNNNDNTSPIIYTLSPKRFLVLLSFSFFSFTQSYQWYTYAGFPQSTLIFYGLGIANTYWIQLYLAIGPVGFVIATPITIWFLDKKGLRLTTIIASSMLLVAVGLKCLALLLTGMGAWGVVLVGQSLSSFAGVVAMAVPPKLSSVWFGPKERSISTSISVVANSVGSSLGYLLALFCSSTSGACVPTQLWIQLGVTAGQFVLVVLFMFDAPPSASSNATDRDVTSISLMKSLKHLLTNYAFVFLVLAAGCSQGVLQTWQALMVEILGSVEDPDAGNWVGFAAQMFGVLGGLVLGALAAVYRLRYKFFIVSLFFASAVAFLIFDLSAEATILPYNFWILAVTASLGSFLCAAAGPLFYELAVELAYPAPEGLVGAIVAVLVNLFGLPVYPLDTLANGAQIVNWCNFGSATLFGVLMLFMKESYQRAKKENDTEVPQEEREEEKTPLIQ